MDEHKNHVNLEHIYKYTIILARSANLMIIE